MNPKERFAGKTRNNHNPKIVIKTLIISDVRLYRELLAQTLNQDEHVSVVETARSIGESSGDIQESKPHVVLLDVGTDGALPGMKTILKQFPKIKIVVLGVSEVDSDIIDCAEAGVSAYVFKENSVDDLRRILDSVVRDELPCSRRVAATLLHHVAELADERKAVPSEAHLTPRELNILQLINEGLTNKGIATRLFIQVSTVKNHVHNIIEKLHVHSRGEAVAKIKGNDNHR